MKRLTKKIDNGRFVTTDAEARSYGETDPEDGFFYNYFTGEAVDKLAAYEDTGLEPADVEALLAKDTNVPDKNVGEWKSKTMSVPGGHGQTYNRWGCSKCKARVKTRTKYCPNCGAEMKGE